jgi:ATP-binding cassette subfamily C protein CydC
MADPLAAPLRRLTFLLPPHFGRLGLSLLLRTINLGAGVLLLGLSGAWIARAVLLDRSPTVGELLLLAGVGVVKAFARYGEQVSGHDAAFRILETLRNAVFAGFARRGAAANASDRSGDLVARAMGDVELVEVYFAHVLAPVGAAALFVLAAGLTVGLTAGPLHELAVVGLLVFGGLLLPLVFQRAGEGLGREVRVQGGALGAEVTEGIAGVQDLLVAGAEGRWASRIAAASDRATRATQRLGMQSALKDVLVDACLVASLLVVVQAAVSVEEAGAKIVLWGVACGLAGGFGAVLSVSRAVDDLPRSAAAARRILEIIQAPAAPAGGETPLPGGARSTPTVTFEGLGMTHAPGRGVFDVDLTVPAGEHVFLTGRSGSGKSTLTAALLGLLRPDAGQVRLDGVAVADLRLDDLRHAVAAAGQPFRPVPGTVLDNVALGCRGEDTLIPDVAWDLPDIPGLLDELGDGVETRLAGADEQLSGGQQRRLGLARLLAREPRVLVLDEAFAGLDGPRRAELRRRVLGWAREGGRTVIEISHETAEAADADRVVMLAAGRVVEEGPPSALLAADGPFAALAATQTAPV